MENTRQEIEKYNRVNQYGPSAIAHHEHTGLDSIKVQAQNLIFTNFMIWGSANLSSGTASVKNSRIRAKSTILVTSQHAISGSTPIVSASCTKGIATLTSNISSDTLNYLIIF